MVGFLWKVWNYSGWVGLESGEVGDYMVISVQLQLQLPAGTQLDGPLTLLDPQNAVFKLFWTRDRRDGQSDNRANSVQLGQDLTELGNNVQL